MKTQINVLKAKLGTYREVAAFLEITERRVMQIVAGGKVSPALSYRIDAEADKEIKRIKRRRP